MTLYHRPTSLDDALALRAAGPVIVLAGGTDIYPVRAARQAWGDPWQADILDVSDIDVLRGIREEADHWRLGATTTWTDLAMAELPPLFDGYRAAAREVGGAQVQNRGTLAGNIVTASPAGDGIPCLMALDASVELASASGVRTVRVTDFVAGYRRTLCRPDEIITAILVPKGPGRGGFVKLGARRYLVISIVMASGVVETDASGRIAQARIAIGASAATALRLPVLEAALIGQPVERAASLVTEAHLSALQPIDDIRASAGYRASAALTITRDLLNGLASPRRSLAPSGRAPAPLQRGNSGGGDASVNGVPLRMPADRFTPLSETLRDSLGLTGTKIGCEAGDCGACTVIIDGRQACACLVPTLQVADARIETIESRDPLVVALQEAFLAHGAAQCGICTPGMIMAATDLLRREPAPTTRMIEDGLGGVLCRCTGYAKIIEAVAAVARGDNTAPWPAQAGKAVGQRVARADGQAKVDGTELFGADTMPGDALWLRVLRSPHASATFELGDLDAFRAARPGLVAILTAADVPGENSFGIFPTTKDQPVFAEGFVRYRGEAVLGLLGERAVVEAISFADVPIRWTVRPALNGVEAALAGGAPAIHAHLPDNVLTRGNLEKGDVAVGHAQAAVTVKGHFTTSFVEHAYIEPEAGYAVRHGDRIEVVASTQAPYMDLEDVARVLGIGKEQVRIRPTACGGGFGGKLDVSVQPLLAVAAWKSGRPVRMVYTRTESMASTTKRHPAAITARVSADRTGRLTAFEMSGDFNTGAYASWGPTVANRVPVHATGPYRVPHIRNRTRAVLTNDTPAGAFRGFGVPQAAVAQESLLDDLAEKLGLDRWAIRRLNAIGKGDVTATGQILAVSAGLPDCLDALKPDWDAALARVAAHNASERRHRRGVGIACMWYGCGNTSMSNPSTMRVTLDSSGRLTFFNGAVDIGQGSTTVLLQICADALGLPMSAFSLVVGDTDLTPDAGKTSASRQTFVSGKAAFLAGQELRAKLLLLANAGPAATLTLEGTSLTITDGEASRTIDLATLEAPLEGIGLYDPPTSPLDRNGQGVPYATYGFAAQIAEVEVDMALGTTKVLAIVAAHDVGRAINPTLTEGQIHGGIAQGLGLALMEEFIPGRTENLHDYLIPTIGDIPPITVRIIEDPEPEGPYGAKGVGEPALVATAPAILSAIRHATGVTMRHVPVLPHRLWDALESSR